MATAALQGPKSMFTLSLWLYLSKVKWSFKYSIFKIESIFSSLFFFFFFAKVHTFSSVSVLPELLPCFSNSATSLGNHMSPFLCFLPGCPDLFPARSVFTQTISAVFLLVFLLQLLAPTSFPPSHHCQNELCKHAFDHCSPPKPFLKLCHFYKIIQTPLYSTESSYQPGHPASRSPWNTGLSDFANTLCSASDDLFLPILLSPFHQI